MSTLIPKDFFDQDHSHWPKVHIVIADIDPEVAAKMIQESMMQLYGRAKYRAPTEREKQIFPGIKRVVEKFDIESVNLVPKESNQ